jgi:excinuclease ABC subunit B
MAEALSEYMFEAGLKVRYIHSDVDTLERIEIIRDLRLGIFDALIGINLLREGLDIPECALVAILDADKEGYLRSKTSLIQTIGRAARHVEGNVILYADTITGSMQYAIDETNRRRKKQIDYNIKNKITPKTVISKISNILENLSEEGEENKSSKHVGKSIKQSIQELQSDMEKAASNLEFEEAAKIRDKIKILQQKELGLMVAPKENYRSKFSKKK